MTIKVTYNVTDVYMSQSVSPVYINVSYSDGGASGGGVWGTITGTLSNQTDLQNALNAKFDDPTGTTSQYLRGDGSLATFPAIPSGTVSSVGLTMPSAFSVANSPVTSSGTLAVTATGDTTQYIAGDGSLVAFPITGQAGTLVREVRNNSGATITKGTVVYINGASGNRPTIAKAIATGDPTSAQTFGLVQDNISNNSNGYIVAFGDLDGLDTSAITEGSQLYLSATVLGGYTSVKQYAPNHLVYIGVVTRSHPNQGRIEVRIQNGYEMDELHDVSAQTPSNNDGLFYNSSNGLWENKSINTALGYTPVPTTRNITINGVTYDLSADRTWTIAAGISGSGTINYLAKFTGAGSLGNSILREGTDVISLGIAPNTWTVVKAFQNQRSTFSSYTDSVFASTQLSTNAYYDGSWRYIASFGAAKYDQQSNNQAHSWSTAAAGTAGNAITFTQAMTLFNTGNLSIGTSSDLGVRLGVSGDTLLRGSGNTSATTALTVQNSASSDMLRVRSDSRILIGGASTTAAPTIYAFSGITGNRSLRIGIQSAASLTPTPAFNINQENDYTYTTGTGEFTTITANFLPTSGTGTLAYLSIKGTINQTGGANGITRGLYVNPTLTAAADFRAIETARGNIVFSNLPTSSAGLPSGALWNNGGVINIV